LSGSEEGIAQFCRDGAVYHQPVDDVTAFILAGGKSSRMGEDKAFLRLGDETLISRALNLAKLLTPNVRIVGESAKFAKLGPVVEDVYPERGPLGGIHAALLSTKTALNLMLAVDTPFIERGFLEFLILEARGSDAIVTVPRSDGHIHPLCAVYRKEFAAMAEQSLILGQNRIDLLFSRVKTRVVEEPELQQFGFRTEMFRNINTPEEWQEAELRFCGKTSCENLKQ
jgi:molybdopterin-guanine dinucleotide biosynthesis protein A